jgi:hypothetical protein
MIANFRKTLDEKGMALITSILILAAAGVIAIALSVDTTVGTRIASNQKALEVAFRNAEAGLEHARLRLGGLFSTAPLNLVRLQSTNQPNWDFFFALSDPAITGLPVPCRGYGETPCNLCVDPNSTHCVDPDCDSPYDEKLLLLGTSTYNRYKVFVRDSEDVARNCSFDSDSDQMVILRSVGFGPEGSGAKQIVELRVRATGIGTHSGYYAQEGGGPTKANVNLRDRDRVDGGQISPGYTLR